MSDRPPLNRAAKVRNTDANYTVTDGNVAAIDFGTTSVSLAYTTKGDENVSTLELDSEKHLLRVTNAILFLREGRKITVSAFGEIAKIKFMSMKTSEHPNYVYFERIKMLMKRDKNINRESLVDSFSGEKFYLVEVIAFILKHVKDLLIQHLLRSRKPMKTTDFDWVITVPAIWDARGKRMMREAAYLAGLLTESDGITQFSRFSYLAKLPIPVEVNADKLTLALEPESAALYSQVMVGKEIAGAGSIASIKRPTNYMVIDIGGGTVDITAHEEVPGEGINVVNVPTGNAWGGTQINEAFSKMLQELVNDPEFKEFLVSRDQSQEMATLNKMIYFEFESQKVLFGECKIDEMAINLSNKFVRVYDELLQKGARKIDGVEYDDDVLYISKQAVESKLFGPAIEGIISCMLKAIEDNKCKADTFYLVGGFGGCKYVHEKVKFAIERLYRSKGLICHVVVPPTPHLAVATGAAMWRKDPEILKARQADATYGIKVSDLFDASKHDKHYRYYDKDDRRHRCKSVFKVFLLKGELVKTDEVMITDLMPISSKNEEMTVKIYMTPHLGVQYVEDEDGKEIVEEIGQLVIDIPNPRGLPVQRRKVDISMDFSGTEIHAKAKYRLTGEEVKIMCDFLSAKN